jgi:uncharacterized membrane protein YoaK (UPF0700 family)
MKLTASPDPISLYILLGMTAQTGIVDAVSFFALGHIFTANMTGNVVFLGFALVGAAGFSISRSSLALIAFLLGAAIGGHFANRMSSGPLPHWASSAFVTEGLLLITAALASLTLGNSGTQNSIPLFAVIGLTALAMGIRNATVRKLGVPDLTTTVLTLTITGLAADSSLAGGTNPRWRRRIASVLAMFAGATVGALMLNRSVMAPLCLCGIMSIAGAIAIRGRLRRLPGRDSGSASRAAEDSHI